MLPSKICFHHTKADIIFSAYHIIMLSLRLLCQYDGDSAQSTSFILALVSNMLPMNQLCYLHDDYATPKSTMLVE